MSFMFLLHFINVSIPLSHSGWFSKVTVLPASKASDATMATAIMSLCTWNYSLSITASAPPLQISIPHMKGSPLVEPAEVVPRRSEVATEDTRLIYPYHTTDEADFS